MMAHRSQLFAVPEAMGDRSAVLVEPLACAMHAALRAQVPDGGVGADRRRRHRRAPHRARAAAAHEPGPRDRGRQAPEAARGREARRRRRGRAPRARASKAVRRVRPRREAHARARAGRSCWAAWTSPSSASGSTSALDLALRTTTRRRPRRARPASPAGGADLTPLWFRELELVGAYTGGTEDVEGGAGARSTLALETRQRTPDARRARRRDVPARPLARGASTTRCRRRQARNVQGGVRATGELRRPTMPRPGFVLEVDERTPPLLVHEGEGFRMQKFPLGHARGVPARPAARHQGRRTPRSEHALLHPVGDSKPLPELLTAGHEAHHRDRRHLDPAAADAHARHPPAHPRARDRARGAQGRRGRAARSWRRRCTAG